jgi:hypothetical protein
MDKLEALRNHKATKKLLDVARGRFWNVGWLTYLCLFLTALGMMHQCTVLYGKAVEAGHEHKLREEYIKIPQIERFHFAHQILQESRRIASSGVLLTAFRNWWENTLFYSLFSLHQDWRVQIGLLVFVTAVTLGSVYIFFMYRKDIYGIDKGVDMHLSMANLMRQTFPPATPEAPATPLTPPPALVN